MLDSDDETGGRSAPILRLESLGKSFGAVRAIDGLSLDVAPGECFCLLGPSGCGKSTLLRLVGGFESPDAGRILLDGEDLTALPPHRRQLNTMFQSYALFPHLSVGENVGYGLRRAGMRRAEREARVEELLRFVRLEGLAQRSPDQISGGQRQRVALARALARRPRLLLLDEPLGALDRKLREETQTELKTLQRQLGTTFVVVTHDQDEAMVMADRIGIMEAGRLVQVGPPRELYRRPLTRFVAEFLGNVNLIEGRVLGAGGAYAEVEAPGLGLRVRAGLAGEGSPQAGAPVTLAIRPESFEILPPGDALPDAAEARVLGATFRGDSLDAVVRTAGGAELRVTLLGPDPEGEAALAPGGSVRLRVKPGAATVLGG